MKRALFAPDIEGRCRCQNILFKEGKASVRYELYPRDVYVVDEIRYTVQILR